MQQDYDIAIVHLTDLHFPVLTGADPGWVEPMNRVLRNIGREQRLRILGLAVTGDFVDSPDLRALSHL